MLVLLVTGIVSSQGACARCGNQLYEQFELEPGYTNLNHGSYGCVPKPVMAHHRSLLERVEANPDRWFRSDYRPLQTQQRLRIAAFVKSRDEDLVFVENASAGCNAFLRSFAKTLSAGVKVLHLSCAYGMVKQILALLVEQYGVELVEVPISADDFGSDAAVLVAVRRTIAAHGGPAAFGLGVISHISSIPAIILPIEGFAAELTGVPVFVDGAHAPGQINLDLAKLRSAHSDGLVAYTGNLHKWAYSPKGTAFLWASPDMQKLIIPPTLSGGAHNFMSSFAYTGTRDYTCFCATGAGLDFRASLGTEAEVIGYGNGLALWAGEHLSSIWKTSIMQPPSSTGWMTNVRLPSDDPAKVGEVATRLLEDYKTMVVFYGWSEKQWTRLSSQVYLQKSDFERLGRLVVELLAEVEVEAQRCGHPGCSRGRKYVAGQHMHELTPSFKQAGNTTV